MAINSTHELSPGYPSIALRCLQRLVRLGIIPRGYSRLIKGAPSIVWGGKSVLVSTNLGEMCLPTTERSSSSLICLGFLPHEARETVLISKLAAKCKIMFDIGAHLGWYSRLMACANPNCTIFAFEPGHETFHYLYYNVKKIPTVQSFNIGIGENTGKAVLYQGATSDLSSTVRTVGKPLEIKIETLDRFCHKQNIDCVDFIKCDVEGGEVNVLRGARKLLRSRTPPIWMLEISESFLNEAGVTSEDLLGELGSTGKLFTQNAEGIPVEIKKLSDRIIGNNVFFVPEERIETFLNITN